MTAAKTMILAFLLEFTHLLVRRKKYGLSFQQLMTIFGTTVVAGLAGALISHYLERGYWGIRYYGTVFFVNLALIPISRWIRVPYGHVMDYVSPESVIVIAVMKIGCLISGCCSGRTLYFTPEGIGIAFPSQMVEAAVAVIILLVVVAMERMPNARKYIYPVYLIAYSATRLVFDSLRADQGRTIDLGLFQLSVAHIFCAVMVVIGCVELVSRIKDNRAAGNSNPA